MSDPTAPDPFNPFADFEVLSHYSRSDAIRDGVLFDLTAEARQSGFKLPLAVTEAVYRSYLDPSPDLIAEGQSLSGRTHDLLHVLRVAILTAPSTDTLFFNVLFVLEPGHPAVPIALKALIHPGDDAEPVITILLPLED